MIVQFTQRVLYRLKSISDTNINYQRYFCEVILPSYSDLANNYKTINEYKDIKTFEEVLSLIMGVEINKIVYIINKLKSFINEEKDLPSCMSIKL